MADLHHPETEKFWCFLSYHTISPGLFLCITGEQEEEQKLN